MKGREKRLLGLLIAVLVVGVSIKYVYPKLLKPLLSRGEELQAARSELFELDNEIGDLTDRLETRYHDLVRRTGGTNADDVRHGVFETINDIFKDAKLKSTSLKPKEPTHDRKTGIATMQVTVSAKGRFEQCVDLIERFYEIPYIARLENLRLTPTHARGNAQHDEVTLSGDIEVKVLPDEPRFGPPIGEQPKKVVAYDPTLDHSALKNWKPFSPYVEPLRVKPTPAPTPEPDDDIPVQPRYVQSGPPTDPSANNTVLRMTSQYGVDEVMLENVRSKENWYVEVGGELDAGELVLVHPLGVVVHKHDEERDYGYFVYPLGESLGDPVPLQDASEWPEIQVAALNYLKKVEAQQRISEVSEQVDERLQAALMHFEAGHVGPEFPVEIAAQRAAGDTAVDTPAKEAAETQPAMNEEGAQIPDDADTEVDSAATRPSTSRRVRERGAGTGRQ